MKRLSTKNDLQVVVILAGGRSGRMGSPKGLLDFHGRPWFIEQIRAISTLGPVQMILVLGYFWEDYQKVFINFQDLLGIENQITVGLKNTSVAINQTPENGSYSSLVCGCDFALQKFGTQLKDVFVLPIDVPCPESTTWQGLRKQMSDGIQVVRLSFQGRRGGHPILLSREFVEKLLKIPLKSPDARLDRQIAQLPLTSIQTHISDDIRVIMNLNNLDDWQKFVADSEGNE